MDKLKTLKDIDHPAGPFVDSDVVDYKIILKQEAIKHYKYHIKQIEYINEHSKDNKQVMRMMSINGWLWNFFNITDEDLKEHEHNWYNIQEVGKSKIEKQICHECGIERII